MLKSIHTPPNCHLSSCYPRCDRWFFTLVNAQLFSSVDECRDYSQAQVQTRRWSGYQCLHLTILINQLDKKWEHASDFGITTTRKNPSTLAEYGKAIFNHSHDPATIPIGTYQPVPGSKVYFNPKTNLTVTMLKNCKNLSWGDRY